jgi:hypothetical protein
MTTSELAELYEEDFVRWAEQQAAALREAARAGANLPLDWENLAEEIESLGISQRREFRSRLVTILGDLLKLEYSPAVDPRRGWTETIGRERLDIELLLGDSPVSGVKCPKCWSGSSHGSHGSRAPISPSSENAPTHSRRRVTPKNKSSATGSRKPRNRPRDSYKAGPSAAGRCAAPLSWRLPQ